MKDLWDTYWKEFFSINNLDIFVILLFICFFIYKSIIHYTHSKNKFFPNLDIFSVSIIDKKAYWTYNDVMYHADVKDQKIVSKTTKKINSMGMSLSDMEDIIEGIIEK